MATVPNETSEVDFTGNGVTTAFAVGFPILESSDLVVELTLDGETEPTPQVEGVHYSVSAAPSDNPTVTMVTAPPADSTLHIERTVRIVQEVNLLTQGAFSPSTHTEMHDRRTMVEQQLDRRLGVLEATVGTGGAGFANVAELTDDTNVAGVAATVPHSDHQHAHGERGGGALHALAVAGGDAGFLSGADKTKLDSYAAVRSHVHAQRLAADQNLPNNTNTTILFDTELYDSRGEYDPATGLFTALEAGYYHVVAGYSLDGSAAELTENETCLLTLVSGGNAVSAFGAWRQGVNAAIMTVHVAATFLLAAGGTIFARARQQSDIGSTRQISSDPGLTYLCIDRIA